MAWKRLDTQDVLNVRYYPHRKRLKAHLKSGYSAEYMPISEERYSQLVASGHHHDIDIFFRNMITPYQVSKRPTLRFTAIKIAKRAAAAAAVIAFVVLLGLWNSGVMSAYLIFPAVAG